MKTCRGCGETKPLSEFYRKPDMKDGLAGACKICAKAAQKKRRPDHLKANRQWRLKHPLKYIAHYAIKQAVRYGRIIPPIICQHCFSRTKLEAHHEDYNRPLDVVWLCAPCHGKRHIEIKQNASQNSRPDAGRRAGSLLPGL